MFLRSSDIICCIEGVQAFLGGRVGFADAILAEVRIVLNMIMVAAGPSNSVENGRGRHGGDEE